MRNELSENSPFLTGRVRDVRLFGSGDKTRTSFILYGMIFSIKGNHPLSNGDLIYLAQERDISNPGKVQSTYLLKKLNEKWESVYTYKQDYMQEE